MLPKFCRHTVTVYRAPLKEARGSTVRDWENATTHEVAGCSVQPSSTASNFEREEQVTDRWQLFAPPNSDIQTGDRVEFDGTIYEIDGAPYQWESATGRVTHKQAHLIEWEG